MEEAEEVAALVDACLPIHFAPRDARIFLVLFDRRNRIVLRDGIAVAIWNRVSEEPTYAAIGTMVKVLRRKLRLIGWPVTIVTARGLGFRLECPKDWHWRNPDN